MIIKLFVICCVLTSTLAWLPPERCDQSKTSRRVLTAAATTDAGVEPNIEEIAAKQHELLMKTYANHEFLGIPVRGGCGPGEPYYIYAPHNCTFHTYAPRLLSSVACNVACKLTHTVSTVDTYTSSEGYNWGAKISSKASFFAKIFEVGGEASTSGSYTCTYTKGKTTTDTVECSESTRKSGHLQLYNVKSDMVCDFGRITLEDLRGEENAIAVASPMYYFTKNELEEIEASAAARFEPCSGIMIDTNKISDRLFEKILKVIPEFNPYTDMVSVNYPHCISVNFLKKSTTVREFRSIIPFTNEGGDSVFEYACMLTQF